MNVIDGRNCDWEIFRSLRESKIAINAPFVQKKKFKNTARSLLLRTRPDHVPGVVYLFREFLSEEENSSMYKKIPTKIGYCKLGAIGQRLEDISKHHYRNLYVAGASNVDDAKGVELVMHLRYKKDNINGEWFNLSEYQIRDAIRFLNTENIKQDNFGVWFFKGHKNCIVAKENLHYFWDEVSR